MKISLNTYLIFAFLSIFLIGCNSKEKKTSKPEIVESYIAIAENRENPTQVRTENAQKAAYLCSTLDTRINKQDLLIRITTVSFSLNEMELFKKTSKDLLEYSVIIQDSLGIGRAYLNLASYFKQGSVKDSTYYYYFNAEKIFGNYTKEYPYSLGKAFLGMAMVQQETKEYAGSQANTIKAIEQFEKAGEAELMMFISYSNLGIVSNELGKHEESINYHLEAIKYAKKIDYKQGEILGYNNIGIAYKDILLYDKALEYFSKVLNYKAYLKSNRELYAMVLDNIAYVEFLSGNDKNIPGLFFEALRIRDSIDNKTGIITNNLHLAEYYQTKDSLGVAAVYAKKAEELSKELNNKKSLLDSYLLLSEVSESEKALGYAKKHIILNDSLHKVERNFQDKIARIRFETEQIEVEKEKMRQQNEILIFAVLGISAMFLFIYIIIKQQQNNKELQFARAQQSTNEEIYRLLLNQQIKLEEGRQLEQHRMSEDLHDGVLGRLFGVRLSLDGINERVNDEFTEIRSKYIDELKSIEKEIRLISHDLGTETISPDVAYVDVVESLVSDQCTIHKVDFEFKNDENIDWEEVDDQKKVNLFRILQESLQNIFKHAKAEKVKISFFYEENKINLTILDDGIGFRSDKVKRGIGLKNITSRVDQMNGTVKFISSKDMGTTVAVSIPI